MSILLLMSKVFEEVTYDQLCNNLNKFLNSFLCGFRTTHSTQHALFNLFRGEHKEVGQWGFLELFFLDYSIVMDLSITYDYLPGDLLMPKLEAYGLDMGRFSLLRNIYPVVDPLMVTCSNLYVELRKTLYWVHCFQISLLMRYFFEIKN